MTARNLALAVILFAAAAARGQEIAPSERGFVAELSALRCAMLTGRGPWQDYVLGKGEPLAVNLPKSRISVLFAEEPLPGFKPARGELLNAACGAEDKGIYYMPGRLGRMERNFFDEKISGREAFIFNLDLEKEEKIDVYQLRLLVHEYFHGVQHGSWRAEKNVNQPLLGDIDAGTYAWMLIEDSLLARALMADDPDLKGIAREFIRVREYRRAGQPASLAGWDDQQETWEGSALYTDLRAESIARGLGTDCAPERITEIISKLLVGSSRLNKNYIVSRYYATGAAEGVIMDRLGIKWQQRVMNGEPPFSVLKDAISFTWIPAPGRYLQWKYGFGEWLDHASGELSASLGEDKRALRDFQTSHGPRLIIKTPYLQKALTAASQAVSVPGKNPREMDRFYRSVDYYEIRRTGEFDILVKDAQLFDGYTGERLKRGKFTWDGRYGEFLFPENEKIYIELDGRKIGGGKNGEFPFERIKVRSERTDADIHTPGRLIKNGNTYTIDIFFPGSN